MEGDLVKGPLKKRHNVIHNFALLKVNGLLGAHLDSVAKGAVGAYNTEVEPAIIHHRPAVEKTALDHLEDQRPVIVKHVQLTVSGLLGVCSHRVVRAVAEV